MFGLHLQTPQMYIRKKKSENMKYSETCQKYIGQNKNFEKSLTNFVCFQEAKASIKACWQKFW